jgi:hypothetical protein
MILGTRLPWTSRPHALMIDVRERVIIHVESV